MYICHLRNVSVSAQCLSNFPETDKLEITDILDISNQTNYHYPGQIWTPDDQCKMIYGINASFCQVYILLNKNL